MESESLEGSQFFPAISTVEYFSTVVNDSDGFTHEVIAIGTWDDVLKGARRRWGDQATDSSIKALEALEEMKQNNIVCCVPLMHGR